MNPLPTLRTLVIEIAVMLGVGAALAILGPFGSFAMGPLATRLAYWIPAALGGWLIFRPTTVLAGRAAQRLDFPEAVGHVAGVLVAAAPMTLFIRWLNNENPANRLPFETWLQLYVQIAVIGAVVTLLFALLSRPRVAAEPVLPPSSDPVPAPVSAPASPFLERLPPHIRADLVALEMEDHYVRAHSPGASALILLRMRDAVAELDGVEGMRVHRSWWVARDAVEKVVQDRRNVRFLIRGGLEVPAARAGIPALRAAGWLENR